MLRLENVSSRYDAQVIVTEDISLTVIRGDHLPFGEQWGGQDNVDEDGRQSLRPEAGSISRQKN
jgi:hypothetical protein